MKKRSNWFWNILIIATLLLCTFVFILHYKNYTKIKEGHFQVVSGFYKQRIPLTNIHGVEFVPRIPEMERKNGFSWLTREKGVFLDSVSGNKIYVFVDDLQQRKLKIQYGDSRELYLNLTDSLETQKIYTTLKTFMDPTTE